MKTDKERKPLRHSKKMAAPIVVTLLVGSYYLAAGWLVGKMPLPFWGRLFVWLVLAALLAALAFVLAERIHEIRSGEEDDLGKY
jgi:fatty acid desaturase